MFALNTSEEKFLNNINFAINSYINNLPEKYYNLLQLKTGNRFRPLLVYYGYTLNKSGVDEQLLKIAFSIELIHKASTIIDDIIDQDTKRRELDSCHVQHSVNEAIILSIHMLGEVFTNIDNKINAANIIGTTIKNMCLGTIKELNMSTNCDLHEIKEIINLQTTSIIKNCLLLGFALSGESNNIYDIEVLGSKLGYLFQLLNDCEAIFNHDFIQRNKGNKNFDYNKFRKNICITYIQTQCNKRELNSFPLLSDKSLLSLVDKYKIKDLILEEILYIKKDINFILNKLGAIYDVRRISGFIAYTIKIAENRANLSQ